VIRSDDYDGIFPQTFFIKLLQKTSNVIVDVPDPIVVLVGWSTSIPIRLGVGGRAAVRFMYVEIVKEYKKRVPGVAINPIDNLAIDGVGMLSQAKTLTVA